MLSKFITAGDKIEMRAVDAVVASQPGSDEKVYYSAVSDIRSEDTLDITVPMEKAKLVLLPMDVEYDMIFYGSSGLYQCFAKIVDRYKSDNQHVLVAQLTSNLRKYQRREYYRFSCALEMHARDLQGEEVEAVISNRPYTLNTQLPLKRSVIVDISGGGLRFLSTQRYEQGSLLYCRFQLFFGEEKRRYELIGRVLAARGLENRRGTFEHRVQFFGINQKTREEIIRFIFQEERKNRNRGK